jgi:hypothetical protein
MRGKKPRARPPKKVRRPAETISRRVRKRFFYSVPEAGKLVGLNRIASYRAAKRGQMPVERFGGLMLVPRQSWDRQVRYLLNGPASEATGA